MNGEGGDDDIAPARSHHRSTGDQLKISNHTNIRFIRFNTSYDGS